MHTGRFSRLLNRFPDLPAPLRRMVFVGRTLIQDLLRSDLTKQASAMAYVTLLSLIPSLVAIFCILALFSPATGGQSDLVGDIRALILKNLASGSGEAAVGYLDRMLADISLSTIGWSSFGSVLVTLLLLLRQIEEALNRIWLIRRGRNAFTRFLYFWAFMTLGVVVIAVLIGVTSGFDLRTIMRIADSGPAPEGIRSLLRTFTPFAGGFVFFYFLYTVVPNCRVKPLCAGAGALVASFLLLQGGRFYGLYVVNAASYQTLYGALAQLPIFLMWLYICWIIILLGALLSWRLQEGFPKETEQDGIENDRTPAARLRNQTIQTFLPVLGLILIAHRFLTGSGKGLTAREVAEATHIPMGWVQEALATLEALGLIVATQSGSADTGGPSETPWFPAIPPAMMTTQKLVEGMDGPFLAWLKGWSYDHALNLARIPELLGIGLDAGAVPPRDARPGTIAELVQVLGSSARGP